MWITESTNTPRQRASHSNHRRKHDAISTMSDSRHSDLDIGLEFMARAGLGDRHRVVLDVSFRNATILLARSRVVPPSKSNILTVKGRYRSFWQMNHVAQLLPAKHRRQAAALF
jgi:hypothetical protein